MMSEENKNTRSESKFRSFDRKFFSSTEDFTFIGSGSIGGKAKGLAYIKNLIDTKLKEINTTGISVSIPRMTVLTTSVFDEFMKMNNLYETAYSGSSDEIIAVEFQKANLPASIVGDLRSIVNEVTTPLAIRSSSMLEDEMYQPFAGIYETKMIPNNQLDPDSRFRKLTEAIKFVYASTFFKPAKDYIKATMNKIEDEKMAVIIQEVVGTKFGTKYYPHISGVGRSYNFYAIGRAKPQDGVVNLALGLGKTIVDGGISWSYSPAHPKIKPPFGSIDNMLEETQKTFWSVNMGKPPAYDPTKETEYLIESQIQCAEEDGALNYSASVYDVNSDRMVPGLTGKGPRVINFSPILEYGTLELNRLIRAILKICEEASGTAVEIEFAVTLDNERGLPARLGFLQVRPMVVSTEKVEISEQDYKDKKLLLSSDRVLGNGIINYITDIVYATPEAFDLKYSEVMAKEIEEINAKMQKEGRKYLLIGFGRWGSSDPWLGIPVKWGQISEAKVIVESTLPEIKIDLSQGSHFFHNITSFQVLYFSVKTDNESKIDWKWLEEQETIDNKSYIKHIKLKSPMLIKSDGKSSRGIIIV